MQFNLLKRRDFITLLGGAAALVPLTGRTQEVGRTYRIGGLSPSPRNAPHYVAFFDELRRLGFVEGQNLSVDGRGYGVRNDQFMEIAAELVKAQVGTIFCAGDVAIRAAQRATATIPIVAVTDDMVGSGLVRSLANPDGNTTGVSILATELDGKRQDILMEAVPGLRRMAALADSDTTAPGQLQALQEAARARSIELSIHRVARSEEIVPAIDAAKTSGAAALNVLASPLLHANRRVIIERAATRACLPHTNGRKRRTRAASSRTARASSRSFERCLPRNSSRRCGAPNPPICRSSSRQGSSSSSI